MIVVIKVVYIKCFVVICLFFLYRFYYSIFVNFYEWKVYNKLK